MKPGIAVSSGIKERNMISESQIGIKVQTIKHCSTQYGASLRVITCLTCLIE